MAPKPRSQPPARRRPGAAPKPTVRPAGGSAPSRPASTPPSAPPSPPPRPDPSREDFSITSCECDDCRAACRTAPGWFTPQQIPRLARHLDLSIDETFRRYLAIGVTHLADGTRRLGVMPHKLRDGKKPGSRWTLAEIAAPGRCVFYDRGRCTIYPARPDECARMMHDRGDRTLRIRRRIVEKWTEAALAPFLALVAGAGGKRPRRP